MKVTVENHLGTKVYHCYRVELWKLEYSGTVLRLYDYSGKDYSLKQTISLDEIRSVSFADDDRKEGDNE